jgi:hypothetical protein
MLSREPLLVKGAQPHDQTYQSGCRGPEQLTPSGPFIVITMLVMIAILSYWPQLALWLPRAAAA